MKKILSVLLIVILTVSLVVMSVSADDSSASIELVSGGITIVDPGVTPPTGYEDIKTTKMDFGIRKITGEDEIYPSIKTGSQTGGTPSDHPGVEQPVGFLITDARGAGGVWNVTVKGEAFENSGVNTLSGYTISLVHDGTIVGPAGGNSPVPEGTIATPVVISETAGVKDILASGAGGSTGMWGVNWNAKITVPGGTATAAAHSAVITWGIVTTP